MQFKKDDKNKVRKFYKEMLAMLQVFIEKFENKFKNPNET